MPRADLEELCAQLQFEQAYDVDEALAERIAIRLGLSMQRARLVAILYRAKGRPRTTVQIKGALPCVRSDCRDGDGAKVVAIMILQIRRQCGQGFIESAPRNGIGYWLGDKRLR